MKNSQDEIQANSSCDRRNLLKIIGVAGIPGLAGCTNQGDSGVENSGNGETEMASQVTGWAWGTTAEATESSIETYEKDVTVEVQQIGRDSLLKRIKSSLLSGSGAPGFSHVDISNIQTMMSTGGLVNITDRIDTNKYLDYAVSGATNSDGEIYGLPMGAGPIPVFYRRSVYEEYGIDPSSIETYDQYIEEGKKLPGDVYLTNLPNGRLIAPWRFNLQQLGGQAITKDGKVNVHSEKGLRSAQNIKKMYDAGIASYTGFRDATWFSLISEGKLAGVRCGAWLEGTIKAEFPDQSGDWGLHKLPAFEKGGTRASNWGGSFYMLPNQNEDPVINAAWDFISYYLGTPEVQNEVYKEFGEIPAIETAYDAPYYKEESEFFGGQAYRQTLTEIAKNVPGYSFTPDSSQVGDAVNSSLARMLDDQQTPEEAVQEAAERIANATDRELA